MTKQLNVHNIADLRLAARRRLPKGLFDYVDRGTEEEVTLRGNRQAFDAIRLLPQPLVDISHRSTQVDLFGHTYRSPVCIGPTGLAGMLWFQGEVQLAQAAAAAGVPFALSTASIAPLEEVVKHSDSHPWFQLNMWKDPNMSWELVERAKKAGFKVLIVTIDSVVDSNREHNRRNGFTVPMRLTPRNVLDGALHPRWTLGVMGRYVFGPGLPEFANYPAALKTNLRGKIGKRDGVKVPKHEANSWDDIRRLRDMWDGPLVVKGVLSEQAALAALECGADGIIVSNHGGRTLDGSISSIEALPAIVEAIQGRITVLLDSGVTRGSDVAKAIALGANAVLVGRAALWGIGAAGKEGAARAIDMLTSEFDRVMAYLGCNTVDDLGPHHIYSKK
ncbi:alpha-hydroxy acid oxidase [Bordetella sp. BOR01]|uniref:alpha-hydroxy acid oxidase n=1 Tax=Bordetella sp. BOR01 TaxID=2854779 RepID=UPI001C46C66F|nr:alpha-hydroxy acid oxidase [Bordetella sp. BOR01]MBV7483259.1 alpha-hydroxy-acid oxidizing protein [Bordetella sp. BOR01]